MKKQQAKRFNIPFVTIEEAATITGLSKYHLRKGIKTGDTPHIRCGNAIKVNLPQLLDKLGVPYEALKI